MYVASKTRQLLCWLAYACVILALGVAACAPAAAPDPPPSPPEPGPEKPVGEPAPKPADELTPQEPGEKPAEEPSPELDFDEQAVADFYRGKTLRIIIGSAPGGAYDVYSRLLGEHMARYIPGSPTVIVESRTGAGGMIAANSIYNTEPSDGTVVGSFSEGIILRQAIDAPGVEFDATRFQWIGSLVSTAHACVGRTDSGITSFQDVIDGQPLVLGTQAPGSTTHSIPAVINAALGTNMQLVSGYDGIAPIVLATEAGEVDGYCASWRAMLSTGSHLRLLEDEVVRFLIIMGDETPDHPMLEGVPAAGALAETEEARELLRAVHAPSQVTNPYVVHPEAPSDRVQALRNAFWAAVTDEEFLADAEQINATFIPSTGEEVTEIVQDILDMPPDVLSKVTEIFLD